MRKIGDVMANPAATVRAPVEIDESQAAAAAEVLKSIAHPLRLRILCVLSGQEENVKGMAESAAGAVGHCFPATANLAFRRSGVGQHAERSRLLPHR